MKPRSGEYLKAARTRLDSARSLAKSDPSTSLSAAYYAALYSARAALSEHDVQARSHRGAWHEFRLRFVIDGPIDAELATEMQRLQAEREQADYDAAEIPPAVADAAIDAVDRFILTWLRRSKERCDGEPGAGSRRCADRAGAGSVLPRELRPRVVLELVLMIPDLVTDADAAIEASARPGSSPITAASAACSGAVYRMLEVEVAANAVYAWAAREVIARRVGEHGTDGPRSGLTARMTRASRAKRHDQQILCANARARGPT